MSQIAHSSAAWQCHQYLDALWWVRESPRWHWALISCSADLTHADAKHTCVWSDPVKFYSVSRVGTLSELSFLPIDMNCNSYYSALLHPLIEQGLTCLDMIQYRLQILYVSQLWKQMRWSTFGAQPTKIKNRLCFFPTNKIRDERVFIFTIFISLALVKNFLLNIRILLMKQH